MATKDEEEKDELKETLELTPENVKEIGTAVKEDIASDIEKTAVEKAVADATAAAEKKATELFDSKVADLEKVMKKDVQDEGDSDDAVAKAVKELGEFGGEIEKMSPAMRFFRAMRSTDPETGNRQEFLALNKFALASQLAARDKLKKEKGAAAVEKAGYANETTAADGAVLIPDAEFVTTVFDNLPNYGVAFRYADVRQTDRTSVRVLSLDSGLTFYSTAEAGVKTSAKLGFAKNEVSLQKYAVIVPATDELTDDAAIDYWNLVTRELSRAYAKKADELVFTDATYGLTNQSGVLTHTLGSSFGWEDLLNAESKTEDDLDESDHRWYMRKESWFTLIQQRADAVSASDGAGLYLAGSLAVGWTPNPTNPTTPWGREVVFTRVLPTINAVNANDAVAVYGSLKNTILYNKRGMALMKLTEASILDSEGAAFNLATQDATAMRAVIRLLHILPKGNRTKFVIVGTGTVS